MSYPRFEFVMDNIYPGYGWEPITVTTADDYILTLFHIWNPKTRDKSKGPVIFQHGAAGDGTMWLELSPVPAPHFYMADLGHDVYVGNNRGTEYSQTHKTYSAETDQAEYWNFTFADMAEDVLANVKAMTLSAGTGKGWYYGHSQGTIQMLVALAKYESELNSYLNRVILMNPCMIGITDRTEPDLSWKAMSGSWNGKVSWSSLRKDLGIQAINGPTWDEDQAKICQFYPSDCESGTLTTGFQAMSVKCWEHWYQNNSAYRFQEYIDDWAYPDQYRSKLYDLDQLTTIPVSLIIGKTDNICTASQAYELADKLHTLCNVITYMDRGHEVGNLGTKQLYGQLSRELETTDNCKGYSYVAGGANFLTTTSSSFITALFLHLFLY